MAEVVAFRWDYHALREVLASPHGVVGRDLAKRAIRVTNAARLNATGRPVEFANNPEGRGPKVDTGRLRSSIGFRIGTDTAGLYADVGTSVPYGYWLETGLRNGRTYPFLRPALSAA